MNELLKRYSDNSYRGWTAKIGLVDETLKTCVIR